MSDTFLTDDSQLPSGLLTGTEAELALTGYELSLPDPFGIEMPWEVLGAMIQGRSSIDLTAMPVYTEEEAREFVASYGFDLDLPEDQAEMEAYFIEAVHFIEHRFLTRSVDWEALGEPVIPLEKIPLSVTANRNVLDLLLLASQPNHPNRPWACALLKVIHTLVYIQNSPLYKHHAQASEAILSRFREVLLPQGDGTILLKGRRARQLRLYAFEAKHHKPRESILIKLLCKKENVAENVWDLVGVRLVTFRPAEALLAVDILREQKVILFPNVIPSRSRNMLVDFEHLQALYEQALSEYQQGQRSLQSLQDFFQTADYVQPKEGPHNANPLSSPQYRSLHITCRHLLRVKSGAGHTETRFAFPYEIQVLDKGSYLDSRIGDGAHAQYKQRQLIAARRRVMGPLLKP
ncbi:TIGR04552 family protein [Vampirovibrio chlorellavorus]|uniref:TIGR04552 family protein n=1 Tax=Vampirovibrio chlorellavorus TaxID=758823 RepID=UPI0026F12F98|nr:TIGR04552 family protein [Vampirovibrio chlorellavorus]